jgi:hypothetical protein
MGKWAIPTIEVTGLVACIIFGVLWLIDPDSRQFYTDELKQISGKDTKKHLGILDIKHPA